MSPSGTTVEQPLGAGRATLAVAMQQIEGKAAALYLLFAYRYPEDRKLWLELYLDGTRHALEWSDFGQMSTHLPLPAAGLSGGKMASLASMIATIGLIRAASIHHAPTREEALRAALRLKESLIDCVCADLAEVLGACRNASPIGQLIRDSRRHIDQLHDCIKSADDFHPPALSPWASPS